MEYFTPLKEVKAVLNEALVLSREQMALDPRRFRGWVDLEVWMLGGG